MSPEFDELVTSLIANQTLTNKWLAVALEHCGREEAAGQVRAAHDDLQDAWRVWNRSNL